MSDQAPLESVVATDLLASRAPRAADLAAEQAVLTELVSTIGAPAQELLQRAADAALRLTTSGSAGASVFDAEGSGASFRWYAVAGALRDRLREVIPADASPPALVVERATPVLFRYPERRYRHLAEVRPQLIEDLHVPLRAGGRIVGSFWVAMHDTARGFDATDLRVLEMVASVAGAGYLVARELDVLRNANRRKDRFLGVLSHEIRNPLAAMTNAVRFLSLAGDTTPDQARARAVLTRQLTHVTRLSEDLLDVARLGDGTMEVRREPTDLLHAIRLASEAAQPGVDEYGRAIDLRLDAESLMIEGDPARLTQIVTNLLTNVARRSGTAGRVHLGARAERADAVVTVWGESDDVAVGWDESGEAATPRPGSAAGQGIGIALARGLTELHGGRTAVVDVAGLHRNGFELRFPLIGAAPANHLPAPRPPAPERQRPRRERVLIIDDSVDASDSLTMLLRSWGHDVRSAQGAAAGLGLEWEFNPDAVILDIEMPGKSGYEVAAELRTRRRRDLLLVALSGLAREEDRARSLAAGFDHHLTKPANVDMLRRLLA